MCKDRLLGHAFPYQLLPPDASCSVLFLSLVCKEAKEATQITIMGIKKDLLLLGRETHYQASLFSVQLHLVVLWRN